MGREIHRVPLDFSWPLRSRWEGYVNPFYKNMRECPACGGSGYNRVGKFLSDTWYRNSCEDMFGAFFGDNILSAWDRHKLARAGWSEAVCGNIEMAKKFQFTVLAHWSDKLVQEEIDALIERGRLRDFTHTWTKADGWQPKKDVKNPTPDEVAVWAANGMGHDAVNRGICIETRAKRFGIDDLDCKKCDGSGEFWSSPEDKIAAEEWESSDPPIGDGWQMWETTSEGSPISPVFDTPEKLARWLADTRASTFGSMTASYDTWMKMIVGSGWSPSCVVVSGKKPMSGVEAVSTRDDE